jgi:Ca2+-binding EF-hand superfamily protein
MQIYRSLALVTILAVAASAPAPAGQAQQRQRGMDRDKDGVITRAEWRGTAEGFRQQDTNRDGVLSGDEVRAVGSQDPAATAASDDETRLREAMSPRFAGMDTDRDGVVSRAEWRGGQQAFRQQDTNRDGVLSGHEVDAVALKTAEETRRREAMSARFNRADRNRDGRIARSEWTGNAAGFTRLDRDADGIVTREEFTASTGDLTTATSGERRPTPAYQAGYDKGTAEGRQAGRDDRNANGRWDLEGQRELEQADSGYEARLGARDEYRTGYRAGFRLGYKEGFGPRESAAYKAGHDRGIAEGRQAGKDDRNANGRWDLEGQREFEQADSGYEPRLGARDEYQAGYRAGFRLGYTEGFGPRNR